MRNIEIMRRRAERIHRNSRDEIPVSSLVGHIPDKRALEALYELRKAGEIEQTDPGFWRLTALPPLRRD